jgi:5-methylcytosine-specific restriction endonuclease McrA
LSLKQFTTQVKARVYEKQSGICIKPDGCGEEFEISQMDADHKVPWNKNGKTIEENCQLLCASCNRSKRDR